MAIVGHINNLKHLRQISNHPLWHHTLAWLAQLTAAAKDQEFTIAKHPPIKAFVKRFDTAKLAGDKYEAHRAHVDLHYCLSGGEVILVSPTDSLEELTPYDEPSDNTFFRGALRPQEIDMHPGDVALLFPADAHLPAQYDGINQSTVKAIIKLPIELFHAP